MVNVSYEEASKPNTVIDTDSDTDSDSTYGESNREDEPEVGRGGPSWQREDEEARLESLEGEEAEHRVKTV